MITLIKKLARDEQGATAVEYGLIVTVISIALLIALTAIGENMSSMYDYVSSTLTSTSS